MKKLIITSALMLLTGWVMAQIYMDGDTKDWKTIPGWTCHHNLDSLMETSIGVYEKAWRPLTVTLINHTSQSDTLYIPLGYKFIKVGDKVYKIVTSLEEVKKLIGVREATNRDAWQNNIPIINPYKVTLQNQ